MAVTKGTYFKALFLLLVFSMGTVVSFACSISELFHSLHHHNSSATLQHEHANGEKHAHEHNGNHHDILPFKDGKVKHDCCSTAVTTVQLVEKSLSRSVEAPKVFFITPFLLAYASAAHDLLEPELVFAPDNVRWRLPATTPNLRIVIQSFQI